MVDRVVKGCQATRFALVGITGGPRHFSMRRAMQASKISGLRERVRRELDDAMDSTRGVVGASP